MALHIFALLDNVRSGCRRDVSNNQLTGLLPEEYGRNRSFARTESMSVGFCLLGVFACDGNWFYWACSPCAYCRIALPSYDADSSRTIGLKESFPRHGASPAAGRSSCRCEFLEP